MNHQPSDDKVAKLSRLLNVMIIGLAVLVAGISFVAFWMSFSVLRDLGQRSGLPAEVSWGLPVVIDGSIVAAILVILAWRMCGKRALWPWVVLGAFSIISIVGNGAHTAIAHEAAQGVPLWLAIVFGAIPPIGLMTSCEMLVRLPKTRDIEAAATQTTGVPTAVEAPAQEVAVVATAEISPAEAVAELEAAVDPRNEVVAAESDAIAEPVGSDGDGEGDRAVAENYAMEEPVVALPVEEEVEQVAATAPVTPLSRVGELPATKPERIQWIADQARAGQDIFTKDLAEQFGVTERSVQRYVEKAREIAPEAFSEPSETEDLVQVS